ncbi:MAG: hypothetical protein ACI8UO_002997 [Verrucomicrobiales bacterium]|jgi:hypothetical protein
MIAEAKIRSQTPSSDESLVGTFRTIGETGPLYEVISQAVSGEVRIEVVHSGEQLDYPADEAATDPLAR